MRSEIGFPIIEVGSKRMRMDKVGPVFIVNARDAFMVDSQIILFMFYNFEIFLNKRSQQHYFYS